MRQIKFKGKRIRPEGVQDAWAYGSLIRRIDSTEIFDGVFTWFVDPDTVSQFTGLTDRNGKEIYEGDVLTDEFCGIGYEEPLNYLIDYSNEEAKFIILDGGYSHYLGEGSQDCYGGFVYTDECRDMSVVSEMEIIGSIHDNPELLNEKQ